MVLTIKVMVMEVVMTGKYDQEVMVTVTKEKQKTLSLPDLAKLTFTRLVHLNIEIGRVLVNSNYRS